MISSGAATRITKKTLCAKYGIREWWPFAPFLPIRIWLTAKIGKDTIRVARISYRNKTRLTNLGYRIDTEVYGKRWKNYIQWSTMYDCDKRGDAD